MRRQRWVRVLGVAALLATVVAGGAYLVGRPSAVDNLLHRLPGIDVKDAVQVGSTVVLADWDSSISLLDLESGEVRADIRDPWTQWYAGRGPVALITTYGGGASAYGHDGDTLWTTPQFTSGTARPVATYDDGTTVLRDCRDDRGCDHRALQTDGHALWSQPAQEGHLPVSEWYVEQVDVGRPHLLPSQHLTQPGLGEGAASEPKVVIHDPDSGAASVVGPGFATAGNGVVALLDTTDGACDLTILRDRGNQPRQDLPGVCAGFDQPGLALLGDNVLIADGAREVLIATGDGIPARVPDGLVNVDPTAAGLIGLDEASWLFGTNAAGTLEHRVKSDLLMAHGAETIVTTSYRQPWNPFAGDSVRHEVLDPVTGETCGTVEVTSLGSPTPLPGCRALVVDPRAGESFVVGRP